MCFDFVVWGALPTETHETAHGAKAGRSLYGCSMRPSGHLYTSRICSSCVESWINDPNLKQSAIALGQVLTALVASYAQVCNLNEKLVLARLQPGSFGVD